MRKHFAYLFASSTLVALAIACGGSDATTPQGGLCPTAGCGAGRTCDPTLGCVECTTDLNCGGANKFCVLGRCEACRSNADCGTAAPACWPKDHQCHPACTGPGDCSGDTPICNTNTGACVGCNVAADCNGVNGKPVCNPTTQQCVECATSANCPASAPQCNGRGNCIQCFSNADCGGTTPICDVGEGKCRAGCTSDLACGGSTPKCDIARSRCVQCLGPAECSGGTTPLCDTDKGRCTACLTNANCVAPTAFCKDAAQCVQCLKDPDCPVNTPKCDKNACVVK